VLQRHKLLVKFIPTLKKVLFVPKLLLLMISLTTKANKVQKKRVKCDRKEKIILLKMAILWIFYLMF